MARVSHIGNDKEKHTHKTFVLQGLNQRVNREISQSGWYFMRSEGKREYLSDYNNLFKGYPKKINN